MVSLERIRELYIINTFIPLFFWFGVYSTISYIDIVSFALFKLVCAIFASIYLVYKISEFLQIKPIHLFLKYVKFLILPLIAFVMINLIIKPYLPLQMSTVNFLIISFVLLINFLIGYYILFLTSSFHKNEYYKYFKKFINLKNS